MSNPEKRTERSARKPTPKSNLSPEDLLRAAHKLETEELRALAESMAALLKSQENLLRVNDDTDEAAITSNPAKGKAKGGEGSFELKMIGGCGPYLYKRTRKNGKNCSTYIRKATSADIRKHG